MRGHFGYQALKNESVNPIILIEPGKRIESVATSQKRRGKKTKKGLNLKGGIGLFEQPIDFFYPYFKTLFLMGFVNPTSIKKRTGSYP